MSTLKRKISAPELAGNLIPATSAVPAGAANRETAKSLTATPLIKPIALPALRGLNFKGLGFTRSRSAPPSPREERRQPVLEKGDNTPATVPEGCLPDETVYSDEEDAKMSESETKDELNFEYRPGPVTPDFSPATPHASFSPPDPVPAPPTIVRIRTGTPLRAPVPLLASSLPPLSASNANPSLAASAVASRSSSPASLEHAIIAERMRRAASGASAAHVPKGARFKSSPLTGERAGVIVAEKVKEDGRIPGEREKDAPDKE